MMKRGDVVFFKASDDFISRTIARLTSSNYTHVGLVIDTKNDNNHGIIVEANRFIKTREREFTFDPNHHALYRIPDLTEKQINGICSYARSIEGTGYDYWQILGFFIQLVFHINTYDFFNRANKMICSEFIDIGYWTNHVPRLDTLHIGDIYPQELLTEYQFEQINPLLLKRHSNP